MELQEWAVGQITTTLTRFELRLFASVDLRVTNVRRPMRWLRLPYITTSIRVIIRVTEIVTARLLSGCDRFFDNPVVGCKEDGLSAAINHFLLADVRLGVMPTKECMMGTNLSGEPHIAFSLNLIVWISKFVNFFSRSKSYIANIISPCKKMNYLSLFVHCIGFFFCYFILFSAFPPFYCSLHFPILMFSAFH